MKLEGKEKEMNWNEGMKWSRNRIEIVVKWKLNCNRMESDMKCNWIWKEKGMNWNEGMKLSWSRIQNGIKCNLMCNGMKSDMKSI